MKQVTPHAGLLAAVLSIGAASMFAAGWEDYSHAAHPLGLLGAYGTPHALAFNLYGFVVPGLLAAWLGWRLRDAMQERGWMARIGAWLVLLSALAFAAQGMARLDPQDLEALSGRLHAASWMLWWIAFVPGALLLAFGAGPHAGRGLLGVVSAAAAIAVLALTIFAPAWMPIAIAHRIAFVCWFGWLTFAGYALAAKPRA
ncbi:DUF998 domain-containing protein [Luteimonas sp. SX5]|uniref:DUF998 domain-containing protein n=1 Tax=Luteimonas galliterrae TaxID=2940486 RepID=A0ABT0MFS7_9GAMM|nr:DUF998 domain-containing protein [Luteimonas galliterrae]MCL1633124.1 DUF998 domain-containing protein [Luteimonas galliterrae]